MSNREIAQDIFNAGIEASEGKDQIVVSMVQAGVSLNSAQNWYKDMATVAGITTARVGHKAEALEMIAAGGYDVSDAEVRTALKAELVEKFGVAASTANDYVKAYAKANNIELPTASFGSNPEEKAKIFDWICANPNCDKPEFKDFMVGEMGRGQGSIDEMYRGIELARNLQTAKVKFG